MGLHYKEGKKIIEYYISEVADRQAQLADIRTWGSDFKPDFCTPLRYMFVLQRRG